jgi:rubrerythrin
MTRNENQSLPDSRRIFLRQAGVLSAAAVALLAGYPTLGLADSSGDAAILNVALGLEYEAIATYQIGAESNLLPGNLLKVAVLFQSQHKAHRDALIATINKLGGSPVADKSKAEYMASSKLAIAQLKSAADILQLARRLELGATNAYLGVIPSFQSKDLAKVAGRIAADETMHYTALTQALGDALPVNALSFGA